MCVWVCLCVRQWEKWGHFQYLFVGYLICINISALYFRMQSHERNILHFSPLMRAEVRFWWVGIAGPNDVRIPFWTWPCHFPITLTNCYTHKHGNNKGKQCSLRLIYLLFQTLKQNCENLTVASYVTKTLWGPFLSLIFNPNLTN